MSAQKKSAAVPPPIGRRRTRQGTVLVGVLVFAPFLGLAVAALGGFHPGVPLVPCGLAAFVGFILISDVHTGRPPTRVTGSLLTARTPTGIRTLDLSDMERVRLLTSFSRGGVSDRVILVRDRHGVCIGLREENDGRRVRRALEGRSSHGGQPRVSRAVRAHLGMTADGTGRHTVMSWLATVVGLCCYLGVITLLTGLISR
ncbi:hypothetical protein [Streptomyces sp. NPDC005752]|uniref:hypothetical protein n=1 Tax=Streptomyces sp. NPDC005752 TaxID=3157065 RepID=UPI0033F9B7CF